MGLIDLIDTHAHLDADAFEADLPDVLARAEAAGVSQVLTIGITLATSQAAVALARQHAQVYAVVGIQPNYAAEAGPDDLRMVEELLSDPKVVAVGETGLDRYWDYAPLDVQQEFFEQHLAMSRRHGRPFVVHCREAEADVVAVLRRAAADGPLSGVMHSFCGDRDTAAACVELGLHLSFSGMVTYKKNDELRAVAREVPLDRLLVETDAPYLVPTPHRGKVKRNEPAFVAETCEVLAEVHGISAAEMASQTSANARRLFRLPTPE